MEKYWTDSPIFEHREVAEMCAAQVKEQFGVQVQILKKELLADCPFGPEIWDVLDGVADRFGVGRANRNPVMWYLFFEAVDSDQEALIEGFIVGWEQGHKAGKDKR